jgi:hypothetical protein
MFDDWALEFTCSIDTEICGVKLMRQIVDDAGKRVGLGDFRPQCKGLTENLSSPFGRWGLKKFRTNTKLLRNKRAKARRRGAGRGLVTSTSLDKRTGRRLNRRASFSRAAAISRPAGILLKPSSQSGQQSTNGCSSIFPSSRQPLHQSWLAAISSAQRFASSSASRRVLNGPARFPPHLPQAHRHTQRGSPFGEPGA